MEPYYEIEGPSETEVSNIMQNSEFHLCLFKDDTTDKDDKKLQETLRQLLDKTESYKFVTYKSIRRHPNWKTLSKNILREEVIAHKPYGSYRGFHTFVMDELRKKYIMRVIREIWALEIFSSKLVPRILKYQYCPYGVVYQKSKTRFEYYHKSMCNNNIIIN